MQKGKQIAILTDDDVDRRELTLTLDDSVVVDHSCVQVQSIQPLSLGVRGEIHNRILFIQRQFIWLCVKWVTATSLSGDDVALEQSILR